MAGFDHASCKVFVKREDESGFGISGCKKRKYASLIPWLKRNEIRIAGLIGGARSNHINGILQLLRENQIGVRLYLKQAHDHRPGGNRLLLDLLSDPTEIMWIASQAWPEVEQIATQQLQSEGLHYYLVPEGGSCPPALPGACSLMLDILRYEQAANFRFDHIFIDSGTAMIAGGLCLMQHWLQHPAQIHVVLVAGSEAYFASQLQRFDHWSTGWREMTASLPPLPHLHFPATARSFGSVNATVRNEVLRMAREEGILVDPIYTAKLFLTARQVIQAQQLKGNILIIHSGGGTGLMGFGEELGKKI